MEYIKKFFVIFAFAVAAQVSLWQHFEIAFVLRALLVAFIAVGAYIYSDTLTQQDEEWTYVYSDKIAVPCDACQGEGSVECVMNFTRKGIVVDSIPTIRPCQCCNGKGKIVISMPKLKA